MCTVVSIVHDEFLVPVGASRPVWCCARFVVISHASYAPSIVPVREPLFSFLFPFFSFLLLLFPPSLPSALVDCVCYKRRFLFWSVLPDKPGESHNRAHHEVVPARALAGVAGRPGSGRPHAHRSQGWVGPSLFSSPTAARVLRGPGSFSPLLFHRALNSLSGMVAPSSS